jgi:uncharacterized membrane protein YfcA
LFVLAVFLLAGTVKGVVGLGLPTIAMGLLGTVLTPVEAAAILIVPSLVTNVWQMGIGRSLRAIACRLWAMMTMIVVGTIAGAGIMTGADAGLATLLLGAVLVAYAGLGLASVHLAVSPRMEPWLGPAIGLVTGVVTGATGVFVIPAVPYLQAIGLEKDELVQALGLSFTVSTLALAAVLAAQGALATSLAGLSVAALAPALAGMILGQKLRACLSVSAFRRWFFLGLLILGASMVVHAVS